MRFVHDHQIPGDGGQRIAQGRPPRRRQGHDQDWLLQRALVLLPGGTAVGQERQAELAVQLLRPLLHKPAGHEDQDVLGLAAQAQLAEDEAGFDRLPQADLVRQDRPSAHAPQHAGGRLELVGERLEPQAGQRDKGVKAGAHPYGDRLIDQLCVVLRQRRSFAELLQ